MKTSAASKMHEISLSWVSQSSFTTISFLTLPSIFAAYRIALARCDEVMQHEKVWLQFNMTRKHGKIKACCERERKIVSLGTLIVVPAGNKGRFFCCHTFFSLHMLTLFVIAHDQLCSTPWCWLPSWCWCMPT